MIFLGINFRPQRKVRTFAPQILKGAFDTLETCKGNQKGAFDASKTSKGNLKEAFDASERL